MWAFPQQIVPLSFQLHQELAEEYNGAVEWGYRGLKTLCVEGNISPSNLRNIANQKKPKKPEVDIPEDLDWINTDIIDGWAHLGGADSTAQVHPYKFTLFILKKVLETGAVDLITGKVVEIVSNAEGHATGVKYTTFIDKRHTNHPTTRIPGRVNTQPTTSKGSLHHPDNPTFNPAIAQQKPLHAIQKAEPAHNDSPSESSEVDEASDKETSFRDIHNSDYPPTAPSSVSAASISDSSEHSTDEESEDKVTNEESSTKEEEAEEPPADEPLTDEHIHTESSDSTKITTLQGDQIVLTLGPWTQKLLPSCPISGLRAHSITIQPSKSVSPFALFTEMRTSRTSYVSPEIYPRKDEVYVCGEGDTFAPVPESTDDVEVLRNRCDELFKHVGDISPQLKNGRILKRQACYLPVVDVPSHSGPFIGTTNVDNLYLASGHSCWGINNAPATGLLMAEILLDGEASSASVDGLEPEFYFDASCHDT